MENISKRMSLSTRHSAIPRFRETRSHEASKGQMSFCGDKRQSTRSSLTACECPAIYRWLTPTYPSVESFSSTISRECARNLFSSRWCCCYSLVRGSSRDSRCSARCRLAFVAHLPLIPRRRTSCNFHPAGCIESRSTLPPTSDSKLDGIERKME